MIVAAIQQNAPSAKEEVWFVHRAICFENFQPVRKACEQLGEFTLNGRSGDLRFFGWVTLSVIQIDLSSDVFWIEVHGTPKPGLRLHTVSMLLQIHSPIVQSLGIGCADERDNAVEFRG